jgi:hypothetical protein
MEKCSPATQKKRRKALPKKRLSQDLMDRIEVTITFTIKQKETG